MGWPVAHFTLSTAVPTDGLTVPYFSGIVGTIESHETKSNRGQCSAIGRLNKTLHKQLLFCGLFKHAFLPIFS